MGDSFQLGDADRGVAVFGASDAAPESDLWRRAAELGREIARAGAPVVTGGYGGVMEAASEAARRAGGETIGVTCRLFRARRPNPHLSLEIEEHDLFSRTARLFALSRGFVVLGGGAGTLAELALLWAHARAGVVPGRIVLWDETWARLVGVLEAEGRLEDRPLAATHIAESAAEAVLWALTRLDEVRT